MRKWLLANTYIAQHNMKYCIISSQNKKQCGEFLCSETYMRCLQGNVQAYPKLRKQNIEFVKIFYVLPDFKASSGLFLFFY